MWRKFEAILYECWCWTLHSHYETVDCKRDFIPPSNRRNYYFITCITGKILMKSKPWIWWGSRRWGHFMRGRTATIFSVKALEKKSKSTPSIRQDHSLMYVICRALFLLLLSFLSFFLFFFLQPCIVIIIRKCTETANFYRDNITIEKNIFSTVCICLKFALQSTRTFRSSKTPKWGSIRSLETRF